MTTADERTTALLHRVGARARARRLELGLPVRVVSERSGLSPRFLADVEGGRTNIAIGRLQDLAVALEVSLVSLVTPPLPEGPRQAIDGLLEGLDDDGLGRVLRVVESALDRHPARVVALLGIRGAGKSSVGPRVADTLGVAFVELNQRIEEAAGLALAEIFAMHGEAYYRRIEAACFTEVVASGEAAVVALPGGIVGNEETWELLSARCHSVWLQARPDEHWDRVQLQGDRRLGTAERGRALVQLAELIAQREPLYRRANAVVDTSGRSVDEVAAAVVESVEARR